MRFSKRVTLIKFTSDEKLSPHFSGSEFICPDCGTGIIAAELIHLLERLRSKLNVPLRVTSGYRCPRHNAQIGGAPDSFHQLGLAVDIAPGSSDISVLDIAKAAMEVGFTGVIAYERHVHVDLRLIPYFKV